MLETDDFQETVTLLPIMTHVTLHTRDVTLYLALIGGDVTHCIVVMIVIVIALVPSFHVSLCPHMSSYTVRVLFVFFF